MTVVLAIRCADGVAMASDSQITDPERGLSYPAQKLHPLGKHAAWGGSGSRAVLYDLEQIFTNEPDAIVEAPDIGHALQGRVLPVLEHHYKNFIEDVPAGKPGATPATYVLAAGYVNGHPFIVDFDPHGLIGHYEEIGFHAVGSGSPMAQQAHALLAHFEMGERSVDYGVVAALRVLDALDASSPSVGGPMDICRITPDGAQHLDEEAVAEVRRTVRRWTELEQRALDDLFS
ncbi:proteasome protein [Mycolicibacterium novocastrense]|uniref:20S proteasome subunit alpha or beta n=1 Tax=Mycolicibacterium novocastrense TaxID=59813 RepID=A0AAW5SRP8_MYCNV|nr:proteasome protein [Mycolicibacterium novocastrense]MCV7026187.1 proteasome protein [Mycolicibacterium novocastrense]GAT07577.1 20S proteasome subunit alpha or beta [Mycolicibacterium novocastrense]